MKRRKALTYMAAVMGTSILASDLLMISCNRVHKESKINFNDYEDILQKIANTIVPAGGKHPGFMAINDMPVLLRILNNCLKEEDQKIVKDGFDKLITSIQSKNQKISDLNETDWTTLLKPIDLLCYSEKTDEEKANSKYFKKVKEAILLVYFTNEKVLTKVFQHVKVPGRYDGAVEIENGAYQIRFGLG